MSINCIKGINGHVCVQSSIAGITGITGINYITGTTPWPDHLTSPMPQIMSIDCFKGMCAINKCPAPADLPPGQTCP